MTSARSRFNLSQDHLDDLCRDRQLTTCEINKPNDFYGNASLLKRFAGLPRRYRLKTLLEHSLFFTDDVWEFDRKALLPMNLCWSAARAACLQEATGRPTIPVGFVILYARQLHERLFGPPPTRCGTLAIPYKSAPQIDTHFDHDDYAERLAALPREMQPVSVCVYWKDYLRKKHEPYARRGLQIVSAGHLYDRDFYLRLYDVCCRFRFSVSNAFGTHVFVTVASGCAFSYLESLAITRTMDGEQYRGPVSTTLEQTKRQAAALFGQRHERTTPEQQAFVDDHLGTRHVKSPGELRQILLRAEWLDKFSPLPRAPQERPAVLSPFVQRRLRGLQSVVGSIAKRLPGKRLGRVAGGQADLKPTSAS